MALKPKTSFPSPEDIYRAALPNGITVLARSNFNSPAVNIGGYLPAGSIFETDDKLGLADFVSSMLMRGTQTRGFDAIYNELESVGASLGFDSGVHNANFGGRALAEDLPLLLKLLAESLQTPIFPNDETERLRAQLLTGLALRAQDTSDMADLIFEQFLYPDHPYGKPTDGFVETIQSITRKDLEEFHRLHFGPRGLVIAIVGAIHPKKAAEAVEKVLGGWQAAGQKEPPPLPPIKPVEKGIAQHHPIPGKAQSDLVVGALGPNRKSPDYMAASLGNSVLGQFGMMGRIGDSVREKAGLAYYASSSLNAGIGPGSWEVSAGVNPKNLKKALGLIEKELRRFVKSGVTKEELADSQSNFIGRLPLSLESNGGVTGAILNIHRYDLGMDYYQRYESLVRGVTRSDVVEVARKYIDPDRLVIATAGP
ncbi:MAG: insulinase family protein [Chloroflexi bacterium]|nr:insulinase family protein [Chloroflexi bacterium CFX1]MCK6567280.1 insulinase family protein [Anaerolineales bacterium]MCQ3952074.1 insulinase family protein [Chloroflexota bacterium]MDL1919444.1 insulinase family protein [Chloroflexi bacterium CFX5]NUQ57870.1 insulinase family protein [Anaerolineales bacterium]